MKFISILILVLSLSFSLHAQHSKVDKARSLLAAGKDSKALAYLNKAYNKSGEKELALELISIYSASGNHKASLGLAEDLGMRESVDPDDAVLFTNLLIASGNHTGALDHCLKFILKEGPNDALYTIAHACEDLLRAEKNDIKYKLVEVPFNTKADELSITNYRRHYVMSSNRDNEVADRTSKEDYFDLFMLKQVYGKWNSPSFLLQERDTKVNRASLSYSIDGNRVFYTTSNHLSTKARKNSPQQTPVFSLSEGISMGDNWESVKPLPFMKKGASYKDPALHPEGGLLVFSCNASGSGGFDLFSTEWKDGKWSEPVNLGKEVNSPYHETMAYFNEEGDLFFSSSNPLGFGGYDIYKTENDKGIWLKPDLLPPPINSAYDDLSYTEHYGRNGGYWVSNRPGGKGGYDIYEFVEFNFKMGVTVLDASNETLVEMAEIQLKRDDIDLEQRLTNTDGLAEFPIGKNAVYTISVAKEGYLEQTDVISTSDAVEGELLFANISLKPDPSFKPVTGQAEQQFNNQNFVRFTAYVTDTNKNALANHDVKLINLTSNRMKLVKTGESGEFSQSLYFGNEYAFIFELNGKEHRETFSTIGLADPGPIEVTYIIVE